MVLAVTTTTRRRSPLAVGLPRLLPEAPPATELTYPISPDYIGRWTVDRAIAEIIANAIDADPAGFRVTYADGVLEINDGASQGVGAEGMVLGFSDKRGRTDQIGQFGEGLKIASLVLARDPAVGDVFVETVGYAFTPVIVDHAGIGGLVIPSKSTTAPKVLCWRLWNSERTSGTRVRIVCPERIARSAMARFRQLTTPGYSAPKGAGQVVLDGKPGRIWIGGVLVSEGRDLALSYDLSLACAKDLQNRDRTIIEAYALRSAIGMVLRECTDRAAIQILVERALSIATVDEDDDEDSTAPQTSMPTLSEAERTFFNTISSAEQRRALAAIGKDLYGDRAVFYRGQTLDDGEAALDLQDRGYTELVAPAIPSWQAGPFWQALGIPSAAAIGKRRAKIKREITIWIADKDLTEAERAVLAEAIGIVRATWGKDALARVRVYSETKLESGECMEFLGFYQPGAGGDVAIKRSQLASLDVALGTLTHESAHRLANKYPRRVGLAYSDYRDRSRGFEQALGTMAAMAARRLADAGVSAPELDDALDAQAAAEARGYKPKPGFIWKAHGDRWRLRSAPGIAYADLYNAALAKWAADNGVATRNINSAFAAREFVPVGSIRSLRDGGTAGREAQNAIDATKPLGLSGGVAWWATQGADFVADRYRLNPRSRHFPKHWKPIWQGFLDEVASLGSDFAALVPALRAIAEGQVAVDLTDDAWQEPFKALVKIERTRVGL